MSNCGSYCSDGTCGMDTAHDPENRPSGCGVDGNCEVDPNVYGLEGLMQCDEFDEDFGDEEDDPCDGCCKDCTDCPDY